LFSLNSQLGEKGKREEKEEVGAEISLNGGGISNCP
jgi:hypothetical protein